jgi:hypothetical protein
VVTLIHVLQQNHHAGSGCEIDLPAGRPLSLN